MHRWHNGTASACRADFRGFDSLPVLMTQREITPEGEIYFPLIFEEHVGERVTITDREGQEHSGILGETGGCYLRTGESSVHYMNVRKFQLRKTPNYDKLNLGSLNLSPVIGLNQFNGTHYLGLSLSLNF